MAYQVENLGGYSDYFGRPSTSSPYGDDDSLWTRAAAWSFLQYLADHETTAQSTVWAARELDDDRHYQSRERVRNGHRNQGAGLGDLGIH